MNIFFLDYSPAICAELHCDKHVCKMIIEYAQLLSTAHRVLDGELYIAKTANGRNIKRWRLADKNMERNLYKASFVNHPSAVWVRDSIDNYGYLVQLWYNLSHEYEHRYGKKHATYVKLKDCLSLVPLAMCRSEHPERGLEVPQCMPDDVKDSNDFIKAYHQYYRKYKRDFARWTKRPTPEFMEVA